MSIPRHGPSLLALFALVAVLYAPTLTFHFVDWDDRHHVYANPAVVAPETAPMLDRWLGRNIGYPLPLTLATWRLDRAWSGPATGAAVRPAMGRGYHQTQALFICLFAAALYALGCVSVGPGWPAALLAGIVVAHPVAVEPLAWITGRKDLLLALFATLTLAALWRARRGAEDDHPARWWWVAALTACLAMASKPTGISVAAFYVWAAIFGQPRRKAPPAVAWGAAFLLSALAGVIVVVGSAWHEQVGGVQAGAGDPIARSLQATSWYLQMLAAPRWLRAKYVLLAPGQLAPAERWLRYVGVVVCGLAAVGASVRWRRAPLGWAAAFGLLAWLPVSNLVPLRRQIADSYMLLPLIALSWALVATIASWVETRRPRARRWAAFAGVFLIVMLGLRAAPQVQTWRTSVTLWQHTLHYERHSPQVCRMAGHGLYFEGDKRGAVALWEGCISRFGPELFANNLAIAAMQTGQLAKARRWFTWRVRHHPHDARAQRYLRRIEPPSP